MKRKDLESGWYYAYWAELEPKDYTMVWIEPSGDVYAEKEVERRGEEVAHHFDRTDLDNVTAFRFICKIPTPDELFENAKEDAM